MYYSPFLGRPYGFWSSRRKGKDLPEIRRQLGQSAVPVEEPDDEDQRNDDWEGEEDAEGAEGDEDVRRRLCKLCGEKTMVVVAKVRRV